MRVTILAASQGQGKTTYLRAQLAALADAGLTVGGILAPAVFDGERRVGYDLVDARAGTRSSLARRADALGVEPTVGPYWLAPEVLAAGNAMISRAVGDGTAVIVIDEIGPLELTGGGWAPGLETALRDGSAEQSLIITVRPTVVDDLAASFASSSWRDARRISPPWPDVLSIQ